MFIHSAFIRKNTPELRKKLEQLGYKHLGSNIGSSIFTFNQKYVCVYIEGEEKLKFDSDCINCGENEELFLAVAALRDDSDYMQWFTDGNHWELCDREDWLDMISCLCCGGNYNYDRNGELSSNFHKATPEELIEHFK